MPEDANDPRADFGIVFVHGIGDHKEAETLLTFGEPMTDWLGEWLRPRGGDVTITDARLSATRTEAESPAYALAEIRTKEQTTTCLMTEAWWGESVRPPDSLKLLGWLFYRGPLLIFAHFCLARKQEAPIFLVRAVGAIPLCAAVQLLALVAMILWVIPLDFVRARIAGAVRVLTLTLGDSFVLLEQEFQRATFVARVRAVASWASARCDSLILIAHSQGGAIAHEALNGLRIENLQQFITVGSGLEKLYFLRAVRRDRKALLPAALAAPLTIGWGLSWWGAVQEAWLAGPLYFCGIGALFAMVFLLVFLEELREELTAQLRDAAIGAPWLDLYASHDLVSAGPRSLLPAAVERQPVVNLRSLLHDHVTYFSRPEQALTALWSAIGRALRRDEFQAPLARLARRHHWHTCSLAISFWTTLLAVFAAVFVLREPLLAAGERIQHTADMAGLDRLNRLASLPGFAPPALVWAVVALFLAYAVCWRAFHSMWRLCAAERWRRACQPKSRADWHWLDTVAPVSVATLASLPLMLLAAAAAGLLPRLTMRQLGAAAFFVLLFGFAVAWSIAIASLPWSGLMEEPRSKRLGLFAYGYVIPVFALSAAHYFWSIGAFGFPIDYAFGPGIALSAATWTFFSLRDGRRFSWLAAAAPWAGLLAGWVWRGWDYGFLAALLSTVLAQLAIVYLYGGPETQ